MGTLREALTVNSELYKKKAVRCLDGRGYYVKANSDVEATLADLILYKKGEDRDYWPEAKATTVSPGETVFAYYGHRPRVRIASATLPTPSINAASRMLLFSFLATL